MRTIDAVRRSAVAIKPDDSISTAASVMERAGVGALAVIERGALVGIVTDRDLVRRALAKRLPADARADSVMSAPVVTIDAEDELSEAFNLFRDHAVRRLAIVRGGEFVGMLSVDDLIVELARNLSDLSHPVRAEIMFAHRDVPVPAPLAGTAP